MPNPPITPAQTDALAKLAEIPDVGSEERGRWLDEAQNRGVWLASDDAILTLMSEARKQGQADVLGACLTAPGSHPSDQTPSGSGGNAVSIPSRNEILAALEPWARAARGIPDDAPGDLWTHCDSWPYDLPQEIQDAIAARGVRLADIKSNLSLWIDGYPLSDFRRAAEVYEKLADPAFTAAMPSGGTRDHVASARLIPWEPGSLGGVDLTFESGLRVALPLSGGAATPSGKETETTKELVARLERQLGVKGINSVFRRALAIAKEAAASVDEHPQGEDPKGAESRSDASAVGRQSETPPLPSPDPITAAQAVLEEMDPHQIAEDYDYRIDGEYRITDFERGMLEDFATELLEKVSAALSTIQSHQEKTGEVCRG